MAFCKGGLAAVRNIVHHITDELEKVIDEITTITGYIKALEQSPAVAVIVALIPAGSAIEGWLNTALDELANVTGTAMTFAEKLQTWLDTEPETPARNMQVWKLASLATKAADKKPEPVKTESFYDSAIQLHIMSNKAEAKS